MLFTRLLGWYRRRQNLHIFLLEIIAVFVGITASLIVDDWRQDQENAQRLSYLLEEIHFSLILDRANNRAEFLQNSAAIESALVLAYEDPDSIDTEELLRHFVIAGSPPPQVTMPPGYRRFTDSGFTIPFDPALASIDSDFRELEKAIATLNTSSTQIRELIAGLQRTASRPADIRRVGLDGLSTAAAMQVTDLFSLLSNNPGYAKDVDDDATARSALRDPEFRATIVELVSRRTDAGTKLVQTNARISSIISTIRSYAPDITLPVQSIGIDGSATGLGWSATDNSEPGSKTIPLMRSASDPNIWSTVVELSDGEVKFRADDSWTINWGVPRVARNLVGTGAQFEFGGDRNEYFPNGTAEIRGINIPVRAGRYRVTFNSQTFAYRFELVP